jgi:phage-related minor tail protein
VGSTEFFATGAAFTNGIATRPTSFSMGMMGEAGPEAIMPLSNINGSLGVRAQMPGNEALVAEVRALREEVVNLHAAARAGAMASQDHLQLTRRMTHNGQSMPVTGVQNDPLKVEVAA